MGEKRDKAYNVRVSDDEMKMFQRVASVEKSLPQVIRDFVISLYNGLPEDKK